MGEFSCPACGKTYKWKPELAGKRVKCRCGGIMMVPAEQEERLETDSSPPDGSWPVDGPPGAGAVQTAPAYTVPRAKPSSAGGGLMSSIIGLFSRTGARKDGLQAKPSTGQLLQFWAIALGCLIGGAVFIFICYQKEQQHDRFIATAKKTTATVAGPVSVRQDGRGAARLNSDNWFFTFSAAYQVEGQNYRSRLEVRGDRLPRGFAAELTPDWAGKTLELYYNPKDPNEAQVASAAKAASWILGYLIGGIFMAMGLFGVVKGLVWGVKPSE